MALRKVYKRNGMNCVNMNGTCTYLPDDIKDGKVINGELFVEVIIVKP